MGTGISLARIVVAAMAAVLVFLILAAGADSAVMAGITYTGGT